MRSLEAVETNLFMWLSYSLWSPDGGQRTKFRASDLAQQVKVLVAKHNLEFNPWDPHE